MLYVATHTGLVRLRSNGVPEWVGSPFDLMGFTAHPRATGLVYASGHPDLPTYREQKVGNLGLLMSRDGGQTWRSVVLRGDADFHALAYSPGNGGELYGWSVAGRPGLYRISTTHWVVEPVPAVGLANVLSLTASPDAAGRLLAGTKAGLFAAPPDAGEESSGVRLEEVEYGGAPRDAGVVPRLPRPIRGPHRKALPGR